MRGRVRAALAALITATALTATACGQDGEQTVRAPSPTAEAPAAARAVEAEQPAAAAPVDADYDDLVAALPDVAELAPWHLHTRCVVRTFDCARGQDERSASVTFEGRDSVDIPESVWIRARRFESERAARRWLHEFQSDLTSDVRGRISFEPSEPDDRGDYRPGIRGRGGIVESRVDGWTGFRASARIRYERRDQRVTAPVRYVEIVLRRGRYVAQVNVKMLTPPLEEPASALAQRLVTQIVDHLQGRSTT